jgi:N-acetylglucosaminyl-diphospho-decaprenol L-rhamnosyltransferase
VVPDQPSVAIVIVSYNSRGELDACLQSIASHDPAHGSQICVVDNGSSDGTPHLVRERWPAVQLIEPRANLGFARGNNVGIRATSSDFVLLLNPDTLLHPNAISTLVARLQADAHIAAAGPRLVDQDGMPELSFGWTVGPSGELRQKILSGLYDRRFGPAVRRVERWTRAAGTREWLSGACLLVRRADLDAVGLLDERYFMYTEDVDLCVSLRALGKSIVFVPEARVTHLRGRSAGRNPQTERLRRQSQLAYYAKHHPAWVPVLKVYLRIWRSRELVIL